MQGLVNQKSPTPPLLSAKNLSQAYEHKIVLKDVNLELRRGETIALVGANGSGKTTLLKVLAGLLRPKSGEVKKDADFRGSSLFLPDHFLYEDFTLSENLSLYAQLYHTDPEWKNNLIAQLNVAPFLEEKVRHLSRGQKIRGALCRSFLPEVSVYFLDEPLTGLDKDSEKNLLQLLHDLRSQNKTILLATHQIQPLQACADRWWQMEKGHPVDFSPPWKNS